MMSKGFRYRNFGLIFEPAWQQKIHTRHRQSQSKIHNLGLVSRIASPSSTMYEWTWFPIQNIFKNIEKHRPFREPRGSCDIPIFRNHGHSQPQHSWKILNASVVGSGPPKSWHEKWNFSFRAQFEKAKKTANISLGCSPIIVDWRLLDEGYIFRILFVFFVVFWVRWLLKLCWLPVASCGFWWFVWLLCFFFQFAQRVCTGGL